MDDRDATGATSGPGGRRDLERFQHLDALVRRLVERFEGLRAERSALREQLEQRDQKIRSLDLRILELNQTRQDTAKRLDDLIARLDQLDAQLETQLGQGPGGDS